jgi:hypothetical protein
MYRPLLLAALAVLVVAPGSARADIPEILACADKTDSGQRLACYDTAAAKLKQQMSEAEKRNNTLFGFKLPFSDDGTDENGVPTAPKLAPKQVNAVDSKVKTVGKDIAGHLLVTLENGQVWRLDEYRTVNGLSVPGTPVQIVRNMFNGFYLGVDGHNNELSVSRIK